MANNANTLNKTFRRIIKMTPSKQSQNLKAWQPIRQAFQSQCKGRARNARSLHLPYRKSVMLVFGRYKV